MEKGKKSLYMKSQSCVGGARYIGSRLVSIRRGNRAVACIFKKRSRNDQGFLSKGKGGGGKGLLHFTEASNSQTKGEGQTFIRGKRERLSCTCKKGVPPIQGKRKRVGTIKFFFGRRGGGHLNFEQEKRQATF